MTLMPGADARLVSSRGWLPWRRWRSTQIASRATPACSVRMTAAFWRGVALVALGLSLVLAVSAEAHPLGASAVLLDIGSDDIDAELRLPIAERPPPSGDRWRRGHSHDRMPPC